MKGEYNPMNDREMKKQPTHKSRKKYSRKPTRVWPVIVMMLVITFGCVLLAQKSFVTSFLSRGQVIARSNQQEDTLKQMNSTPASLPPVSLDLGRLNSPYAILVDLSSGQVLAEQNSQERIYPASMTKIMTAILVIENIGNLDQTITMPSDIFPELYDQNASMAGFEPGEEVKLMDLLYGVMLPSGAECCIALADKIAGSEQAFAELMNQKAKAIGMKNSNFCNSTGLHATEHYTTAQDMAMLLRYALENETFQTVFTSSRYSTQPSNQHPEGFTFHSTMFNKMDSTQTKGGEIIGGKTGYTEEAGLCLASLATINGKGYIAVTAKANGSPKTEALHISDAINAFSQIGASQAE